MRMKEIINPEKIVRVPFSKTYCGVDFYINTATSKDIGHVLTEHKRFKTDFFSFYFFRRANGFLLLNFRKIELHDGMVLLLSPHQQQEWHVDEAALDYTFLIFREDFMRTFLADNLFIACCIIIRPTRRLISILRPKNWRSTCVCSAR